MLSIAPCLQPHTAGRWLNIAHAGRFPHHKDPSRLLVVCALQDEQGEEAGSIYSSSPRAMLPSAAQPLSVRGRARYVGTDSMEGLQEAPLTQVCWPLISTDPQVHYRLAVAVTTYYVQHESV